MTQIAISLRTGKQQVDALSIEGHLAIIEFDCNGKLFYRIIHTPTGVAPNAQTTCIDSLELAEQVRAELLALTPDWSKPPLFRSKEGKAFHQRVTEVCRRLLPEDLEWETGLAGVDEDAA